MKYFFQLMWREAQLFRSNSVALLIFIGAPILYAILIGNVYKKAVVKDLPIAVVDLDNTPLSQRIIDALDDNQYIKVSEVKYNSDNMRQTMTQGNMTAIVTIPDRFEANIQQKRYPEVSVDINGANMLTGNYAATGIQTSLTVINAGIEIETLKKKGTPSEIAMEQFEAFKINLTRFFNPSNNYLVFLWPGMLATIMQQVFLIVLALSFTKEYEDRTFGQLLSLSRNPFKILMVKTIPYIIMGSILWFPLIHLFFPAFQIPMVENLGTFYFISVLFMVSVSFLGMAVSIVMPTQLKATEVLMVIATPSFIISGQTWPLEQMPQAIQVMAKMIPLTHYAEAFRGMVMYNSGFNDLLPQIKAMGIILVVTLVLALLALYFKIRKTPAEEI
ncbi:MAG: ABC transporter permease [Breznakibacter sp.]|nr:ABC transporter permease [Breznakibacter sp.]